MFFNLSRPPMAKMKAPTAVPAIGVGIPVSIPRINPFVKDLPSDSLPKNFSTRLTPIKEPRNPAKILKMIEKNKKIKEKSYSDRKS